MGKCAILVGDSVDTFYDLVCFLFFTVFVNSGSLLLFFQRLNFECEIGLYPLC